jgi:pilus assembly protein CpaE
MSNTGIKNIMPFLRDEIWEQSRKLIIDGDSFKLFDNKNITDQPLKKIENRQPDIILIDFDAGEQAALNLIENITTTWPTMMVVAILIDGEEHLIQDVLLAGARIYLKHPFSDQELQNTLNRISKLHSQIAHRASETVDQPSAKEDENLSDILVVFSPRGGSGCTFLASNIALMLQNKLSENILLLDGKQNFGHLDVFFNVNPRNSLSDLVPHSSNLDPFLLEDVIINHVSGLDILVGPNSFIASQSINPKDLFNIISYLQKQYANIVIDAGNMITDNVVTLLDMASKILVPVSPDIASLQNLGSFLKIAQYLNYPKDKILPVLNRSGINGGINAEHFKDALGVTFFAEIPDDSASVIRSINRGIPIVMKQTKGKLINSLEKLNLKLLSELAGTRSMHASSQISEDMLEKSSRLG